MRDLRSSRKRNFLSSSDNPQFEPQAGVRAEPPVSGTLAPDQLGSPPVNAVRIPTALAPIENPVWNGWDLMVIVAVTFAAMVAFQVGLTELAMWFWYPHQAWIDVAQKPILLIVSQFLIYAVVAACMVMLIEGKYHVPFWRTIQWNWPRSAWMYLGFGAVTLIALGLLQNLLPMPKDTPFEHLFDRPRDAYLLAIIAVSFAPLLEELFFRGFLYPVVARRWGAAWGVFLAALPFALLHMQQYGYAWGVVLVIFVVGLICGVVRVVTRSVGASFLVHVGYNGIQMIAALVYTHGFRHMEKAVVVIPFSVLFR
jgi:membrane protease YdiL (CAAX protease family)